MNIDKSALLKQYFGHADFRPGQEALIDALLSGRDALGVMPTGAGKSICYQLPALALPGLTLVISPLISLMKDQVTALREAGLPAAFVNSTVSPREARETYHLAEKGIYKLIYVAPERLSAGDFAAFARQSAISLIAVDEAHCVSQWGQDFRPSYLGIADFVASLEKRPVVGAFTATATSQVKDDIEKLLALRDPARVTTGFDRPNLFFDVARPRRKDDWLARFIAEREGQSGIVYCATRKGVEAVCEKLIRQGVPAARYHAGLDDEERRRAQEDFVYDRARVMVATNAFGMGIDKSNVSFVVHYNMPKNLESYYQEAGRAGRDGSPAQCVLLFSEGDVQTARFLIENGGENEALSDAERETVRRQDQARLSAMTRYCRTTGCLRANLLRYFGEAAPARCDNCGNCAARFVRRDITVEAQKILSGVARVEAKYRKGLGAALIMKMLRGGADQRVRQLGLDGLSTYGILGDVSADALRDMLDSLIAQGYAAVTDGEYPVLRLTPKARDVLFNGERVYQDLREEPPAEPRGHAKRAPQPEGGLYAELKALRGRLAQQQGVPAYIIFSNATLSDMALKRPCSMDEFMEVSGVGAVKARRYGEAFIALIREQYDR